MSRMFCSFNPRLKVLLALSLTVVLCPRTANLASGMTKPLRPSYWVATLAVNPNDYVREEFRSILWEFYNDVRLGIQDHSVWGRMSPEECYDEDHRKVQHCEVVEFRWDQTDHELSLFIVESDKRGGLIYQHECTTQDTFKKCFETHRESMALEVRRHDSICHIRGKCEIKDLQFESSPN